jgi:hypothetical protein
LFILLEQVLTMLIPDFVKVEHLIDVAVPAVLADYLCFLFELEGNIMLDV